MSNRYQNRATSAGRTPTGAVECMQTILMPGCQIQITDQEIASKLRTSRDVISRILEGFASAGLIGSSCGQLEILDKDGLRNRAEV